MPRRPKIAAVLAHAESPEERQAAARQMAGKRWSNTTASERSEFARWVGEHNQGGGSGRPPDQTQKRCPCRRMTLKRARARGKVKTGHKPSCPFHKAA
jgi:hypothetical protein